MIKRFDGNGRMSRAVVHGDTIYLCGRVAKGTEVGVADQTKTVLADIEASLTALGSSKEKMLSATIYLSDISTFAEMNSVWDAWVPKGNEPARTCVEAKLAAPQYLVEITVVASL